MLKSIKRNKLMCALFVGLLLTIIGCSNSLDTGEQKIDETQNPNAEEVLSLDPEADIFQFDGIIYQLNIDWVEKLTLTKNKQIGEIKKRNNTGKDFENEMSNTLPVGAKIFSVEKTKVKLVTCFTSRIR